jgi:RHS repeat-associated protein
MGRRVNEAVAGLWLLLGMAAGVHADSLTRASAFEYDPASGILTKEVIEPARAIPIQNEIDACLVTEYVLNSHGTKVETLTRNCNGTGAEAPTSTADAAFTPRGSRVEMDPRGRFPTKRINALNQSETLTYEQGFGGVATLTGPNVLTTSWEYDGFGRKTREVKADGTETRLSYEYCQGINSGTASCPTVGGAAGAYLIRSVPYGKTGAQNGPAVTVYFDALSREIRTETQGFDGNGTSTLIRKDTQYDNLGRPYKVSRPYYAGQAVYWTTVTYDALSRPVLETRADSTTMTTVYSGLKVTVTNAKGQTRVVRKNSQGKIVSVVDALSQEMTFVYDALGNLLESHDPFGNVVAMKYDQRGRKVQMKDPDMGTWNYAYNGAGELVRQVDAKGQIATMEYDPLGRMTARNEADLISHWYYDEYKDHSVCDKGIGRLCEAEASTGYNRKETYDVLGRPVQTVTMLDTTYTVGVTYDGTTGRLATQTYPTGLTLRYVYTSLGYLREVRDNGTNALYWRAEDLDAEGRMRQQMFGNNVVTQQTFDPANGRLTGILAGAGNGVQSLSYQYDTIGNIESRTDSNLSVTETFLYDDLNRLTHSTVNAAAVMETKEYVYDGMGNITRRSDAGDYHYNPSGAGSLRPHALAELVLNGGGRRAYAYDANGNLTSETDYDAAGNVLTEKGRSEFYTSFNMPISLGSSGLSLAFYYGPEHQRVSQISSAEGTTWYLNPGNSGELLFEKDVRPDNSVEERHFITAGGQVVALVKRTTDANGAVWSTRYLHRDNLGSTTAVTDENGAVVERLAYEPFGKRRYITGVDAPLGVITGQNTDRGFTNHEHLDSLGLIHMNGRIYDPMVGRFVSADFLITDPYDLQAYNRYSYVFNNPLIYTDPSGQDAFSIAIAIYVAFVAEVAYRADIISLQQARLIQAVAVGYALGPGCAGGGGMSLPHAMAAGYASGYVGSNFTPEGGTQGAITAGVFYVAGSIAKTSGWKGGGWEKVALHAGAGCISGSMQGNCGSGAIAGGFNEAALGGQDFGNNTGLGTVVHAVVGGTASVIAGGDFGNGAMTGAFGYMFNHGAHSSADEDKKPVEVSQNARTYGYTDRFEIIGQVIGVGLFDAVTVGGIALDAEVIAQDSGLPGPHNGPQDAYRHCEASCEATKALGPDQAKMAGDVHELYNSLASPTQPRSELIMDTWNNSAGRVIGITGQACPEGCMNAFNRGVLVGEGGKKF